VLIVYHRELALFSSSFVYYIVNKQRIKEKGSQEPSRLIIKKEGEGEGKGEGEAGERSTSSCHPSTTKTSKE
jgi:hypothetical protein